MFVSLFLCSIQLHRSFPEDCKSKRCVEYREKIEIIQKLLDKEEDSSAAFQDLQHFLNEEHRRSSDETDNGEGEATAIADHSEL